MKQEKNEQTSEWLKKYAGLIIGILFTIVFTIIFPELLFKSTVDGIIGGFLVAILINSIQIFDEIKHHKRHTANTIESHIRRIVDVLRIQNEYFDDKWLFSIFDQIVDIVKFTKSNPHDLERVQGEIDKSLLSAKKLIGTPFFNNELERGEWSRILYLNRAIENSQKHVFAVTYDERDYFDNFWQPLNDGYSKLNISAAKRNVTIERIFVMEDSILNNGKDEKSKRFWKIIKELKKGGQNVKLYALPKSRLKNNKDIDNTSIFLCDGVVASESGKGENSNGGYFSLNRDDIYNKLHQRYRNLKIMSKEI